MTMHTRGLQAATARLVEAAKDPAVVRALDAAGEPGLADGLVFAIQDAEASLERERTRTRIRIATARARRRAAIMGNRLPAGDVR